MSDPGLTRQQEALGERRFNEFIARHGMVDAMLIALVMSLSVAKSYEYSDEYLAGLMADADDVVFAAQELRDWVAQVAEDWRAQRTELR